MQFLESRCQRKCLVKVQSFFIHSPQDEDLVKFCEIEQTSSMISEHFQATRISDVWLNDFPIINSVCEKSWFAINGPSKILFFSFSLIHFSKFQMTVVKNFMDKSYFFCTGFQRLLRSSAASQIFLILFWQKNDGAFIFEIYTEMHFVSLFFLSKRNIEPSFW